MSLHDSISGPIVDTDFSSSLQNQPWYSQYEANVVNGTALPLEEILRENRFLGGVCLAADTPADLIDYDWLADEGKRAGTNAVRYEDAFAIIRHKYAEMVVGSQFDADGGNPFEQIAHRYFGTMDSEDLQTAAADFMKSYYDDSFASRYNCDLVIADEADLEDKRTYTYNHCVNMCVAAEMKNEAARLTGEDFDLAAVYDKYVPIALSCQKNKCSVEDGVGIDVDKETIAFLTDVSNRAEYVCERGIAGYTDMGQNISSNLMGSINYLGAGACMSGPYHLDENIKTMITNDDTLYGRTVHKYIQQNGVDYEVIDPIMFEDRLYKQNATYVAAAKVGTDKEQCLIQTDKDVVIKTIQSDGNTTFQPIKKGDYLNVTDMEHVYGVSDVDGEYTIKYDIRELPQMTSFIEDQIDKSTWRNEYYHNLSAGNAMATPDIAKSLLTTKNEYSNVLSNLDTKWDAVDADYDNMSQDVAAMLKCSCGVCVGDFGAASVPYESVMKDKADKFFGRVAPDDYFDSSWRCVDKCLRESCHDYDLFNSKNLGFKQLSEHAVTYDQVVNKAAMTAIGSYRAKEGDSDKFKDSFQTALFEHGKSAQGFNEDVRNKIAHMSHTGIVDNNVYGIDGSKSLDFNVYLCALSFDAEHGTDTAEPRTVAINHASIKPMQFVPQSERIDMTPKRSDRFTAMANNKMSEHDDLPSLSNSYPSLG